MTDNLPPLPPCAPEFKPRWPNDPGGYTADQMQAYALAAIAAQHVPQYDQQALELCEACGWKTLIPDEGCLNCERKPQPQPVRDVEISNMGRPFTVKAYTSPQTQPQPVQQDHYKELAALGWQAIECPVCGSSAQAYPQTAGPQSTKGNK